ncbi:hypothetical protein PHLH8_29540 [Pseudomonas sp. Pc102]|nr:hypothetical protein PHLH8_29540 [Pseudomonas sp. Pc102]
MKPLLALCASAALLASGTALAADAGARPLNWNAIYMFLAFVLFTLGITRWAALRTRSTADFYTAGAASAASRTAWRSRAT